MPELINWPPLKRKCLRCGEEETRVVGVTGDNIGRLYYWRHKRKCRRPVILKKSSHEAGTLDAPGSLAHPQG